ncbi:MAG: redoxin domain-containing protein [Desulfobacterales bacterium]|nr:redoxin domain-containing protein [Desulfobacterales bacterium]
MTKSIGLRIGMILFLALIWYCYTGSVITKNGTVLAAENVENRQPEIGEEPPGFTLKNQDQLNVSLGDFKGEKNVVLVFYPLDFTPV